MLKKWNRRILTFGLCMVCIFSITACNAGEKWTFSLNGEKLYDRQVMAFGLIYAKDYNIKNEGQLEEYYEPDLTYEKYYKEQLEEDIIETVLISKEAKEDGYKLTKEQNEEAKDKAKTLYDSYSEEWLKGRDVSQNDIEDVYKMKLLANSYINDKSEESTGEDTSDIGKERYVKVFEITFPTAELDENGMVQSDVNGDLKEVSESDKQERLSQANDFLEKVQNDEDMDKLLKAYDSTVTGMEKYYKYDDLNSSYKDTIDDLSVGDFGGVIEAKYGYYVVKLLEKDATEYEEKIGTHEEQKNSQEWKANLLKELKTSYVGDDKNYKNNDNWDNIKVANFLQ